MAPPQRRLLIVGGSFAGLCAARDMSTHFLVTIVDCKEYFEYTPGILRAYVKPKHFDALSFNLHPVIEQKMGCKFIWGEVMELNSADDKAVIGSAVIKPMFQDNTEVIDFDYCIIACGCNFNPLHKFGESLWFPTVHSIGRDNSDWKGFDERFIEGRRRHILDEYKNIKQLQKANSRVLVVGAGFIGVEWITELQHFFNSKDEGKLDLSIIDFLPLPLGPLPARAANYCSRYMKSRGIHEFYEQKYAPNDEAFWTGIGFDIKKQPDKIYSCVGVKASNYFMPDEVKSAKGPGGGGWILMNKTLAVVNKSGEVWCEDSKGYARVYAVGDCNYGCVETQGEKDVTKWPIPPIPKISYPGEEEAVIAARNIEKTDHLLFHNRDVDCCGGNIEIHEMHWPWGAGMFATSLGPNDACFVMGASYIKNSGFTVLYGSLSAVQKEFIEHSKVDECAFGFLGRAIWHFVHHTPVHLWGGGPRWGY